MRQTIIISTAIAAFALALMLSVRHESPRETLTEGDRTTTVEGRTDLQIGLASSVEAAGSCSCPQVSCSNGTVASCSASCSGDQEPICSCEGGCNSANGNPSGRNRCFCN